MKEWNLYKIVTRYQKEGKTKYFTDTYDGYNVDEAKMRWEIDNFDIIQNYKGQIDRIYREENNQWNEMSVL